METVIGIVFWGGVFVALAAWFTRPRCAAASGRPEATHRQSQAGPVGAVAATGREVAGDSRREVEALTDGLIIGHFLTRDHYRPRVEELEDRLEVAERDRDVAFLAGDDPDGDTGDADDDPFVDDLFDVWDDDMDDFD